MCGIAGALTLRNGRQIDPALLRAMAAPIRHRGPDAEGHYLDSQGRCGFAFRRLAIIDLQTGDQPLSNEDGTIWLVFNGEIYNFRELRRELEHRGHTFRTHSDSETIVHAYEEHGVGCFERLAGMFAIAIWDARRGELILARDRLGKKPLTYAIFDGVLYFASEAKAILAIPGIPREIDPQALHEYLLFQYVPAPRSIYLGFAKLPPGNWMRFRMGAAVPTASEVYWRPPISPRFDGSYADARVRLGELLTHAVERRLIADVPLGAFLSGGVDSSIVVGLMRQLGVSPLRTFSIGFAEHQYDESEHARRVARYFQTEHHEQIVSPAAREVFDALAWHYDEPFADSSAIPTLLLARFAREHVTVALTGDAGDESFGGYDRYRAAQAAACFDCLPRRVRILFAGPVAAIFGGSPKSIGNRARRFAAALAQPPNSRYLSWMSVLESGWLAAGYTEDFRSRIDFDAPLRWFSALYAQRAGTAAERSAHVDLLSYLPYDLLTKVDLASMACSLECRCPFVDHELVEFAASLPARWKLSIWRSKRILKDWGADLLPPEIPARPKMGFGVPLGAWFRGELRPLLEERVLSQGSLCSRIFERGRLRKLVDSHLSGHAHHGHALWALLMLELWGEQWRAKLA